MSDAYGLLFQRVLYPSYETRLRGRPTLALLQRVARSQWWSLDELEAFQQAELTRLVEHAFQHVPYYRARMDELGIEPGDVRRLEDVQKLPLLSREQAAAGFAERKSRAEPMPAIAKMTSGTSGRPLSFAYDHGSEYWRQAIKLRGYGWAGYQPGDRSFHFWGSPPATKPKLSRRLKQSLDRALRREHYADCTNHSPEALARVVGELSELRPSVLLCYAQAGVALARYVLENGLRDWDDMAVIAAAEPLFPSDRAPLRAAFGPAVFESYGSREVMLMAAECEAHQGLHVAMENILLELIVRDEHGARPARPGELGEVVITDLHNYGAPFIRYLNGDSAIACEPARCGCGRSLLRLEHIEGRTLDTLRDGAGRAVSGMFFSVLFAELAHQVREFQVVQGKDRAIELKLVPTDAFEESLPGFIERHCRKFLPGVELRAKLVPELRPDRNGKRRVVVVE